MGFSIFSASKLYFNETTAEAMRNFLYSYQGRAIGDHFTNLLPAYSLMVVTFGLNFWVLYKGISKGIEKLAKIALPLLLLFALILAIRIMTLGTPDPMHPENSVAAGFGFIWNPNFTLLK